VVSPFVRVGGSLALQSCQNCAVKKLSGNTSDCAFTSIISVSLWYSTFEVDKLLLNHRRNKKYDWRVWCSGRFCVIFGCLFVSDWAVCQVTLVPPRWEWGEAGTNYPGLAVWKGARRLTILLMFLSLLVVSSFVNCTN